MEIVEAVLVMIAACIGFALIARRLNLPYAVILVLGGMVLASVPWVPSVTLDPQIALAFFLPPLLQTSAWRTDWRAFRANLRPILLLAVGMAANWVFPATYAARLIPAIRRRDPAPPLGHIIVISWAGMRGVVSLAAALALPLGFPERDLLIFLAFCAILATLVVQGTTLEWVIRRCKVEEPRMTGMAREEAIVRHHIANATLAEIERRAEDMLEGAVARDLLSEYQDKTRVFHGMAGGGGQAELEARMRIRLAGLRAGRAALLTHHRDGGFEDELLHALESEHDLEEIRMLRILGAAPDG